MDQAIVICSIFFVDTHIIAERYENADSQNNGKDDRTAWCEL